MTLKVNTAGFGGRKLSKGGIVFTNDPAHKQLNLSMQGQVKEFAAVKPDRVRMTGAAGDEIKSVVTIVPKPDYPFNVLEVKTLKENNIKVDMEEVNTEEEGKKYILTVQNLKDARARYFDAVILKTDSAVKPEMKISVYGNIFDKPVPSSGKAN